MIRLHWKIALFESMFWPLLLAVAGVSVSLFSFRDPSFAGLFATAFLSWRMAVRCDRRVEQLAMAILISERTLPLSRLVE